MQEIKANSIGSQNSTSNPLTARPGTSAYALNTIFDLDGWATKRRGVKKLGPTSSIASVLTGLDSDAVVYGLWQFDDHIFAYVEDYNNDFSGIAAYAMVQSGGWHKVVESTSLLRPDGALLQFNIRPCVANRRLLIATSNGVKRIASIHDDHYPKDSSTAVNYSTMYRDAGIVRALDPRCPNAVAASSSLPGLITSTGFEWLSASSAVAYQVDWYKRDENGIPGIGAPSGRVVIRNSNPTTAYATRLKIPIPGGVNNTSFVLQINRTAVVSADATGDIPDPGADMFLAGEYRVTSGDLANGYVLYEDISSDGLLQTALYTNETQEGALAARFQPPICRDIAMYGNCAFFSNTTERQRMIVRVLAVDPSGVIGTFKGIRVGDKLVMGDLVMEGVAPASEETQSWYFAVDDTTGIGSEVIRTIKTTESIVYKYNIWSNLKSGRYYAYNMTSETDVVGVIMLEEKAIGGTTGAYVGTSRVDSPVQILPNPIFTSTPSNTLAQACAISTPAGVSPATVTSASNHNLTTGDLVFIAPFALSTTSGSDSFGNPCPAFTLTQVPAGVYSATVLTGTTFSIVVAVGSSGQTDARTATTGGYFHKIFDVTTSTWTEARTDNNSKINRLMWSAPLEPESAPISNYADIGSAEKAIIRIVPTQDSLFIFKEDGIWRLKGEGGDWEIIVLDSACIIAGQETPAVVDGRVFFFATNGVYAVDDGGTQKISGSIYNLEGLERTIAANPQVAVYFSGAAHGEDQAYWLLANSLYRYHVPTKTWSMHSFKSASAAGDATVTCLSTAKASRVTSFDVQAYSERLMMGFSDPGTVAIERRLGRTSDLCDIEVAATVSSFNASANTVTLTAMPSACEIGDTFLWYANAVYVPGGTTTVSRYQYRGAITAINGNVLTLDISGNITPMSSWPAVSGAMSGAIMRRITSTIVTKPFVADDGFAAAHFSEVGIVMGSRGNFSSLTLGFSAQNAFFAQNWTLANNQSTSTINGYYATGFISTGPVPLIRNSFTMGLVESFRTGVPRASAVTPALSLSITNDRAFEQFDVAGITAIVVDSSNKTRKTNG